MERNPQNGDLPGKGGNRFMNPYDPNSITLGQDKLFEKTNQRDSESWALTQEVLQTEFGSLNLSRNPDELGYLNEFSIKKVLGRGGMGVVYEAFDTKLGRTVAIKMMLREVASNSRAHDRFLHEARAIASLKNDHVVPIYQVGENNGIPFLVMEYLEGQNFKKVLSNNNKIDPLIVVRIGQQIAKGLQAAHEKNLVHRDIKPSNIWFDSETKRIRILDFGLARSSESVNLQLTEDGAYVGTWEYMSPEQVERQREIIDARTDLFSLGVILYEALLGTRPFQGATKYMELVNILQKQPVEPYKLSSGISRNLSDFIMKLLEKKPEKRPASAKEVVEQLRILEAEIRAARAKPQKMFDTDDPPVSPNPIYSRKLISGIALGVIGICSLGLFFYNPLAENKQNTIEPKASENSVEQATAIPPPEPEKPVFQSVLPVPPSP